MSEHLRKADELIEKSEKLLAEGKLDEALDALLEATEEMLKHLGGSEG